MLDINWIRANADAADRALAHRKNVPFSASALLALDDTRKAVIARIETLQARRNALSKDIGQAKAQKDEAKAQALMDEVAQLKDAVQAGESERRAAEDALRQALLVMPNLPKDEVPAGNDEHDNQPYFGPNGNAETAAKARPSKPALAFEPKEHFELGEALKFMDFETAAKISGARFTILKGQLARMERALGQFMLDLHTMQHGYTEVQTPYLVKDQALFGTGQLPKFKQDLFATTRLSDFDVLPMATATVPANASEAEQAKIADQVREALYDRHWLIPTAEVPLTNMVRESILSEEELPLRFTALTPCFRSEAGSAGRDTRGMLRQHQFDKVELVSITTPDQSADEHERMLACAEEVLKRLGLHYRVMTLCTGDMGFGAQKTYDIEVWLPGQDTYREISSCSVCGDFQARRMDARVKGKDGKIRHVHTLNGSALAVGRTLIAVMENYQQADGSITVPEALQPYMGGLKIVGGK